MSPDRFSTTSLPTTFQPGRNIIFAEMVFTKKMLIGQAGEEPVGNQQVKQTPGTEENVLAETFIEGLPPFQTNASKFTI